MCAAYYKPVKMAGSAEKRRKMDNNNSGNNNWDNNNWDNNNSDNNNGNNNWNNNGGWPDSQENGFQPSDYGTNPQYGYVPEQDKGMSIASMVLGIIGLLAWCIPLFGYPITIVGLVLGIKGKNKGGRGMAIAGIVMSIIGLIATVINSALGAMMAIRGMHLAGTLIFPF